MVRLNWLKADLHVHTVLSPCAELDMGPQGLVTAALNRAEYPRVTDHNAWANVAAVTELAQPYGIGVLPGIEVQTREEVHVLCFFPDLDQLAAAGEHIYASLPAIRNRADILAIKLLWTPKRI